ncbi:hypothetical protein NKI48_34045 [Mesorhizobium sp. M0644]|uniref:hypothetical protein n=1 Tax=Mesorhizobium sp. M0644 TaxID=2956979 RepID=UPI0033358864
MVDEPKSALQSAWKKYKARVEYTPSPFPFPPKRKGLFEKLHDDFLALVVLGGVFWVIYKAVAYYLFLA